MATPQTAEEPARTRNHALGAVEVFVALQLLLPSKLTVGPLGQVGTPATIWGLLCLLWYGLSVLSPSSGLCRGRQPVRYAFGFLLVTWLFSYLALNARLAPAIEQTGSQATIFRLLGWIGVGLLAADGLRSVDELLRLSRFLVGMVAIVATVAMLQFVNVDVVDPLTRLPGFTIVGDLTSTAQRGSFNRVAGTTGHPIEFAALITMVLPLALQIAPWSRNRKVWFGAAALIGIGVPISISRTAFLGVAIGLALLLPHWGARRLRDTGVAIVGLAAFVFVAVPGLLGTVAQYLGLRSGGDTSLATRTGDYAAVAPFVEHSPIWGRGVGTFIPPQYRILDNQYLMSLIDTGVLGFIALVALFLIPIFCARDAWSHARAAGDDCFRDIARGLFAAVVVAAVCLATFDAVSFWSFFAIAMVMLGMCGAASRLAKPLASAPGGREHAFEREHPVP
jgi:hypothetical protein